MIVGIHGDTKTSSDILGYETFPEMFDETYDQEYHPTTKVGNYS